MPFESFDVSPTNRAGKRTGESESFHVVGHAPQKGAEELRRHRGWHTCNAQQLGAHRRQGRPAIGHEPGGSVVRNRIEVAEPPRRHPQLSS